MARLVDRRAWAVRPPPGDEEKAADDHWNVLSSYTMMNADHRRRRRAATHVRWRVRFGLALVRAGLVVAPLTVADIAGESPGANAR